MGGEEKTNKVSIRLNKKKEGRGNSGQDLMRRKNKRGSQQNGLGGKLRNSTLGMNPRTAVV